MLFMLVKLVGDLPELPRSSLKPFSCLLPPTRSFGTFLTPKSSKACGELLMMMVLSTKKRFAKTFKTGSMHGNYNNARCLTAFRFFSPCLLLVFKFLPLQL